MESPQGPPNAGTRGRVSGPPPPWGVPPFSSAPWAWGRRGGRPGEGGPGAWGGGPVNLGFGAPATRGHGAAPGSPGEAGPRRSGLSVWKEDRLSDQRYSKDNSVVSPASPDQWGGSRPRCRLKVSWWCSRCQGCGCSPPKTLRELGSERRETVWFLSILAPVGPHLPPPRKPPRGRWRRGVGMEASSGPHGRGPVHGPPRPSGAFGPPGGGLVRSTPPASRPGAARGEVRRHGTADPASDAGACLGGREWPRPRGTPSRRPEVVVASSFGLFREGSRGPSRRP